jgi:hypothetical protein
MYYIKPDDVTGVVPREITAQMKITTYEAVAEGFQKDDKDLKKWVGHCIYKLIGSKSTTWKSAMTKCGYDKLDV